MNGFEVVHIHKQRTEKNRSKRHKNINTIWMNGKQNKAKKKKRGRKK